MNDIDFDELHEAVNAAMGGKGKSKKAKTTHSADHVDRAEKSEDEKSIPAVQPQKVEPKPASGDAPQAVTVRRPLPKLATHQRARGIAMDIVQPKKGAALQPPSARPARTAQSLQPTGPVTIEPPKESQKSAEQPATAPIQPEANEPSDDMLASINMNESTHHVDRIDANTPNPHASTWPDPLDVHGFKEEANDTANNDVKLAAPEPETEARSIAAESAPQPVETPISEPSRTELAPSAETTPFVTTKVEKRPLGAYASQTVTGSPVPSESAATGAPLEAPGVPEETVKTQKTNRLDEPQPAIQDELSPEVVAVESQEPEFPQGVQPAPVRNERPDLQAVSQMAIPKQYKEAEHEPSTEERPVFDTKEYHPPIEPVHAAHRTSSPWGVVLIVVLVLLLIGAGFLAYFVMTGQLDITRWF